MEELPVVRILHLGGNELGDRIFAWLSNREPHVDTATDLTQVEELDLKGYDWIVSAGFRHILPAELLERVPDACNVHTSYLPWGRGAHPNVWAIAEGEPAGVSIHAMTAGVDEGSIYAQQRVPVLFGDVASDLHARLQETAFDLFVTAWPKIRSGGLQPTPQPFGGSYHRSQELRDLAAINLDESVTWRHALDTLRALTFPPHRNLIIESDDRRYHVEIKITEIKDN